MESKRIPILYSLHNCPYAIRARFALLKANQHVIMRAIKLSNKPQEMLAASPKGSVPVLVIPDESLVLEQSLDVMIWALKRNDSDGLLLGGAAEELSAMCHVIDGFERRFIPALNAYSCAKRYHDDNAAELLNECETELTKLERKLNQHAFLFASQESLVDIALMPFIRKLARINKVWFRQCPYPKLRHWLNRYIQSPEFSKVMKHYDLWLEARKDEIYFS